MSYYLYGKYKVKKKKKKLAYRHKYTYDQDQYTCADVHDVILR